MESKNIQLENIIRITKKDLKNPKNNQEFQDIVGKLQIKEYLPLLAKSTLSMAIIMKKNIQETEYMELKIAEMYKNIFFYVLLGGYTNIDISDESLINYENYDLLYPVWGHYILKFCYQDYCDFLNLLKDSINLYNIKDLSESMNKIEYDAIKENTQSIEKMLQNLNNNKELVDKLNNIVQINNPYTSKLVREAAKNIK